MRLGARAVILFGLVGAISLAPPDALSQAVNSQGQPGGGPAGTLFHPASHPPSAQVLGGEVPLGFESGSQSLKDRANARAAAQLSDIDRQFATETQPSAPSLRDSFAGIADTGSLPPDPHIAVGPNHALQAVNSMFRVTSKTGSTLLEFSFAQWWQQQFRIFDPWVVYDHHSGRWVLLAVGLDSNTRQSWYMISVSQTGDPTGNWCRWSLDASLDGSSPTSNWADYPKFGFDNQAFYITSNQFRFSDEVYQYSKVRIMAKDQFYSCGAIRWWDFTRLVNADGSMAFTIRTTGQAISGQRR